jgi:hypothetical protein
MVPDDGVEPAIHPDFVPPGIKILFTTPGDPDISPAARPVVTVPVPNLRAASEYVWKPDDRRNC